MLIQREITVYEFRDMFRAAGRQDNFSYDGLKVLFDYLDDYSDAIGQPIDLDVVALCCDFNELSWRDVVDAYNIDLGNCDPDDEEERIECVRDYLQDNTSLCGEFEEPHGVERGGPVFVFQVF